MSVDFNTDTLDRYLKSALPGCAGKPEITRIAGGQSNPTFFVSYPARKLVLRKKPPGVLLPSAHAIDREFRVISALKGSDVPVPEALLYCTDTQLIGTEFYVMARLEGRVFHECTLPGLSGGERRALYADIARVMAALHACDYRSIGLTNFGRPEGYFTRQIARWSGQWRENRTREDANMEHLIAWLPANIPADETGTIAHGDFRIGNLMIHPTEPRVVGLLDWELATLGHPLADLAHFLIAHATAPDEYGGLKGLDLNTLGIPDDEGFAADYAHLAPHGLALLPFHRAFALFRWAAIFEGIAWRAKTGTASSENAGDVGKLAAVFARRAMEWA